MYPQGSAGVRRVRLGPGRGRVGPGQKLDGEASGVGTVVGRELVCDGDERGDGNAGGMADAGGDGGVVNLYHRRVMVSVHQAGSSGRGPAAEAQSPDLGASAGDSGNVVMGVGVGDNVGNDNGSEVLGDVVVGAARRGEPRGCPVPVVWWSKKCPVDVNDVGGKAAKLLRRHWPGPDTECVVWLFQRFHCRETWGRDPCPPGPAPKDRIFSPRSAHEGIAATAE